MEEVWEEIDGFSRYLVSNFGNVMNRSTREFMAPSYNNFGDLKLSLINDDGQRITKGVANLVADVFLEPPDARCTHVIILDGDKTNVWAENLALRPKWFAWRYTRQHKQTHPTHFHAISVQALETGLVYKNVIVAATENGLMVSDVWRSAVTGSGVYPTNTHFVFFNRV